MQDADRARDQAELGFLMQYLREQGVPAELLEPGGELPIGALVVPLAKDERGRDRYLSCTFVPLDDEMENVRLLQLYSVVPVRWANGTRENVERLLHAVNGRTAVGHFGIKEDGEIHFRYVHCVPADVVLPREETLETIDLFHLVLNMFSGLIDGVASGEIGLKEALRALE